MTTPADTRGRWFVSDEEEELERLEDEERAFSEGDGDLTAEEHAAAVREDEDLVREGLEAEAAEFRGPHGPHAGKLGNPCPCGAASGIPRDVPGGVHADRPPWTPPGLPTHFHVIDRNRRSAPIAFADPDAQAKIEAFKRDLPPPHDRRENPDGSCGICGSEGGKSCVYDDEGYWGPEARRPPTLGDIEAAAAELEVFHRGGASRSAVRSSLLSFPAWPMLDRHDDLTKATHIAVIRAVPSVYGGSGMRWVAVPTSDDMAIHFGRGTVPTLCLCEIACDELGQLSITRSDCWTLSGDEMEALYRDGRLETERRTVELCRDVPAAVRP